MGENGPCTYRAQYRSTDNAGREEEGRPKNRGKEGEKGNTAGGRVWIVAQRGRSVIPGQQR